MSVYLISGALLLACAVASGADGPKKTVKEVPIKLNHTIEGPQLYRAYCAVCHGKEGKGDGPAADALKRHPTDLTTMSKRNGGKYPAIEVREAMRGTGKIKEHGTVDMPMWGAVLTESGQNAALADMQFAALVKYIEELQK
jgi:mono/diheme cytochrome c family protein